MNENMPLFHLQTFILCQIWVSCVVTMNIFDELHRLLDDLQNFYLALREEVVDEPLCIATNGRSDAVRVWKRCW